MRLYPLHLRAHVFLQVIEGVEMRRLDGMRSRLLLQLFALSFVLEGQHTAIGVVDDNEPLRAQQVMRNDEPPQGIFGRDPTTRVADNVRLSPSPVQNCSTVSRASMQARMASYRAGGIARWPRLKSRA
jgi:hypothetical protein